MTKQEMRKVIFDYCTNKHPYNCENCPLIKFPNCVSETNYNNVRKLYSVVKQVTK